VADARESGLEAQRHLKVRQGELLYADVARVYAQTALYQRDDALLKRTEQVLSDRITELEKFRTLGKAREGEIEAALADKAAVSASRAQNQGLLGTSRELLNFLTGKTITNEQFELGVPSNLPSSQPPQVEEAPSRYDIKAKQAQLNAATLERKAAERGHLPTLFLEGNSYLYEEPDSNRDWEVLLKFDLPLFEGGATQAAIAEYRAKERASQVRLKLQEREAIKELKTAHVKLVSTRKELELIDVQRVAARKNLSAQRRDYELGLVTNLDVLAAIQQELEAERKYAGAQADLFIAHAELKVASGAVS
jgi:outer membrane protein